MLLKVKNRREVGGGWVTLEFEDGLMRVARDGTVSRESGEDAADMKGPFVRCQRHSNRVVFLPAGDANPVTPAVDQVAVSFALEVVDGDWYVGQEALA